jgi:hypothetical protein
LKKGSNELLLKISNGASGWAFKVRGVESGGLPSPPWVESLYIFALGYEAQGDQENQNLDFTKSLQSDYLLVLFAPPHLLHLVFPPSCVQSRFAFLAIDFHPILEPVRPAGIVPFPNDPQKDLTKLK